MRMRIGLTLAVLCSASCALPVDASKSAAISLNQVGLQFAKQLIRDGRVVDDHKGAWAAHKPVRAVENEFIRAHGFDEYAKWHLAIDNKHSEKTKAHYKFPFGDLSNVHRCGLLAVKARAREYGYVEIEAAATQLLALIELARPRVQKRVD